MSSAKNQTDFSNWLENNTISHKWGGFAKLFPKYFAKKWFIEAFGNTNVKDMGFYIVKTPLSDKKLKTLETISDKKCPVLFIECKNLNETISMFLKINKAVNFDPDLCRETLETDFKDSQCSSICIFKEDKSPKQQKSKPFFGVKSNGGNLKPTADLTNWHILDKWEKFTEMQEQNKNQK